MKGLRVIPHNGLCNVLQNERFTRLWWETINLFAFSIGADRSIIRAVKSSVLPLPLERQRHLEIKELGSQRGSCFCFLKDPQN